MAQPDLRVLVGVLGGASISGETGQLIISELKQIGSQIRGSHMPRVQVAVDINKTRQIFQQQLQQIANGVQVQATIKTNLTNGSATVFDTAKLEADGRRYFQSTSNIIDNVKQEFASLGTVDVTNVFKGYDGSIQSFTANVKKSSGEVESYRFKLAQLTDGVSKFNGFVQTSSTLTDKTTGTGLQKTLNYLNGIETQIANITSAATVATSKPLLPGTAEYDSYQVKLQEVNTRIQQIRSSTNVLSDNHKREINSMVADLKLYAQQLQATAYSTSELDTLISADTLSTNISTAQARIQNLKTTYSSFVSDPKLMQEWESLFNQSQIITTQDELNNLNAQVKSFEQKLVSAGKKGAGAFSQLAQQFKGIASWMVIGTVISSAMSAVHGVYDAVVDLDTQMVELKKVTDETAVAYDQFLDRAYDKAIKLGTSVTDLVEATANFARLGFDIGDAEQLAEVATIYQAVGDEIDSVDDATQNIISTMNAFGVQSGDAISIVDKLNEVANNFAVTAGGLGASLQRSAASFAAANNTLDESIALTVAANNVVQNPERVGTMWQTVTARIRGATTELEEAGLETDYMAESTSKLREQVIALTNVKGTGGFDILADDETFKSTYEIILGISKVWEDMSDIDQAALLELLAGKRQSNALAAAITNMDDAVKVLNTSLNSSGSAYAEHAKWLESIEAKQQQFTAQFQTFANTFLSSDLVKGAIDTGTGLLGWLTTVIDKLGTLPVLLSTIGGVRSLASNKGLFQVNSAGTGITTSFALSKQAAAEFTQQLNTDIACLQKFETAVQNGTYATGDFDKMMAGASAQAKTYAATTKGAAGSTLQYKVAQDAAASSTKKMGVSAKVASVGVQVLNMAMNALLFMGIGLAINGLVAGFDAMVNAAAKASEKANEFALEQKELAEAASEEAKSIDELIQKYKQLRSEEYLDADSRTEVRDIQSQITSLVGDQAANLDLVNGKLDDEIKKLKQIQLEAAQGTQDSYVASYHADRDAANKAVGEDKFLFADGYGYVGPSDNAAYDILKDLKNSYGTSLFQKGGFFGSNLFSIETGTAEERIEQLTKAMEALKNATDYDYTNSDIYAGLSAAVKTYEVYTSKLNESTSGLVDSTVLVAALQADVSGQAVDSAEAYAKYRQSIIDAALADEALSSGLADNAISVEDVTAAVDDLMATNFPDWYNQTRETVSGATGTSSAVKQYETLADALNAVKQAQDAYQNVKEDIDTSSDKSISLATLSSLVNTYSDLSSVVSDYLAGTVSAEAILDVLTAKFNSAAEAAGYQKDIIEELDAGILELATDADILIDAINEIESGNVSSILEDKMLDNLLGKFPDLIDELKAYSDGLISAGQLQTVFNKALDDFNADALYNGIEDINDAVETYGKSSNQVVQAVQRLENSIPGLVGALYDQETGHLKVDVAAFNSSESIYAAIKASVEMERQAKKMDLSNAIEELEKLRDSTLEVIAATTTSHKFLLFDNAAALAETVYSNAVIDRYNKEIAEINSELSEVDDYYNSVLASLMSARDRYDRTASSSSSNDPWLEAFEAEYNAHKHAVAMEQETLKEFYTWLDSAEGYKKYFANQKKYIEEFRKYAEEVFNGLRELTENSIADSEHQIFLWENQGGQEDKIIAKYREIQNEVHSAAEAIREALRAAGMSATEIENNDTIQSLSKKWWECENAIKDVVDTINDDLHDSLESIYDLTVDMIKQASEDEIDALEKTKDEFRDIIDLQKEMLRLREDERKYEEDKGALLKELAKLQERAASLKLSADTGDRQAAAELIKVQEEIAEKQKELSDLQWEHAQENMEASLDAELSQFEKQKDAEIDEIEAFLNDQSALNKAALSKLDNMNQSLFDALLSYALSYTNTTRAELEAMWADAKAAAEDYGSFTAALAGSASGTASTKLQVSSYVEEMKINAAKWDRNNPKSQSNLDLQKANEGLALKIEQLLGEDVYRDNNGVWWVGNQKLFEVYHTGTASVGQTPTLMQDELFAKLQKGEMVLNQRQQNNLYGLLRQSDPLEKLNHSLSALKFSEQQGPSVHIDNLDASVSIDGMMSDKEWGKKVLYVIKKHPRDVADIIAAQFGV